MPPQKFNGRLAVLIVDMLKDFFKGSPTLPAVTKYKSVENNLKTLVVRAHELGVPVVYVNDNWSNPEELPIDSEFKVWGPHCIDGTEGAEVLDSIKPTPIDFVVRKHRYSGFFNTNLDTILSELDIKTCMLGGVHTNCCVQHTTMDAFFRGYGTILVRDCAYAPTEEEHEQGMKYMKTYYGTEIQSLQEALTSLEQATKKGSSLLAKH